MSLWKNLGKGLEEMAKQSGVDLGEMGKQFQENMENQKEEQSKVQVIKAIQNLKGMGLAEAKAYVEKDIDAARKEIEEAQKKAEEEAKLKYSDIDRSIEHLISVRNELRSFIPNKISSNNEDNHIRILKASDFEFTEEQRTIYFESKRDELVDYFSNVQRNIQGYKSYLERDSNNVMASTYDNINGYSPNASEEDSLKMHKQIEALNGSLFTHIQALTTVNKEELILPEYIGKVLSDNNESEIIDISSKTKITKVTSSISFVKYEGHSIDYLEYTIVFRKK